MTDEEREVPRDSIFVVGQVPNAQRLQIQRYGPATDSWTSIFTINGDLYDPHIHHIGDSLYILSNTIGRDNMSVVY